MKKFLVLIVAVCMAAGISAQDRIAVGLKTGFNSTKINLSDIPDGSTVKNEAKGGFLFGAYGRLKLFGNVSFQPEMYYAKKKTNQSVTVIDGENELTLKDDVTINSWDIPLLAHVRLLDLKVASVYGVAGPVASFIGKAKTDIPELDEFKSTNWSFQAGAGVEFWRLTADVRYEWGLKDISDLKSADIGQKTDVLTVSIGFKLFGI